MEVHWQPADDFAPEIKRLSAENAALRVALAKMTAERDEWKRLAQLHKAELDKIQDARQTPRERVDNDVAQIAFYEMAEAFGITLPEQDAQAPASEPTATAAEPVAPEAQVGSPASPPAQGPTGRPRTHSTRRGARLDWSKLPRKTIVLTPATLPEGARIVDEQVTRKIGFQRGGFIAYEVRSPIYAVPEDAVDAARDDTTVTVHCGDYSPLAEQRAAAEEKAARRANAAVSSTDTPAQDAEPNVAECRSSGQAEPFIQTKLVQAIVPDEIIPGGQATPELLATIVVRRFDDAMPYNRQQRSHARASEYLPRSTMCSWVGHCADAAVPVVAAMTADAKLCSPWIGIDATGVNVQAKGRCERGHFLVLVCGSASSPVVDTVDHIVFDYTPHQTGEYIKTLLDGFHGTMLSDMAGVYLPLLAEDDAPDQAGCNAHSRRYLWKAIPSAPHQAAIGVGAINELFAIERLCVGKSPAERLAMRKERSAPVIAALLQWCDQLLAKAPTTLDPGSPLDRAVRYIVRHRVPLTRFLEDGRIPIHNNFAELSLRLVAIGRNNWLFLGRHGAGRHAATFLSLVESCRIHKLDSEAYLRDLFRVLPHWPHNRFLELCPRDWRATRARLDPGELELPYGRLTIPSRPLIVAR